MNSNNVEIVNQDDQGLFIRLGTQKFSPQTVADQGGTSRGKVVRAWKAQDMPSNMIKVQTPQGHKLWARRE